MLSRIFPEELKRIWITLPGGFDVLVTIDYTCYINGLPESGLTRRTRAWIEDCIHAGDFGLSPSLGTPHSVEFVRPRTVTLVPDPVLRTYVVLGWSESDKLMCVNNIPTMFITDDYLDLLTGEE